MLKVPSIHVLVLIVAALGAAPAVAANRSPKQSAPRAAKATKPGPVVQRESKPVPAAVEEPEPELDAAQVALAGSVLVGAVVCESGQSIRIAAAAGRPGHFVLTLGQTDYDMVPYETATGAVRLEDRKGGVVWLQIPSKSMLLSARLGQRLVDNCMHETQRSAVVASADALGIAEPLSARDLPDGPSGVPSQPAGSPAELEDELPFGALRWTLAALWPAVQPTFDAVWADGWSQPRDALAWTPPAPLLEPPVDPLPVALEPSAATAKAEPSQGS